MTRLIHTGDTHVGYRQYNSPERRADFRRGFEAVVEDAVDDGVDAVVHAGDLFHDRRPSLEDVLGVLDGLRRLDDADVPFLAVVGNHEATRGGQWLDLFERLGLAVRLGREPSVVGDLALYGLDYVPASRRDALEYAFEPHDADASALVAHGQFAPLTPDVRGDAWDLEAILDASPVAFDVALLGDDHTPRSATVAGVEATYCGSTERTSASEREGRGYNLVSVADGEVTVTRRALETRPFVFVPVELAPGEGVDRVRERVRQHDLADAVVVVEVTGDGEPVTPADVESAALAEGALVARVADRRDVDEAEERVESVSFADPDEAVRERVAEMGLSTAAHEVDEVVRESTLADSNVRDVVAERVREHLDAGLDAFEPAAGVADADPASDDARSDGDETGTGGGTDGGESAGDGADGATDAGPASDPAVTGPERGGAGADAVDGTEAVDGTDEQRSMGEFE
jgi:DNA repair exonuclease SbcCD nuclease subunit